LKSFLVQQKIIGAESNRNWPNSPGGGKKSILTKQGRSEVRRATNAFAIPDRTFGKRENLVIL
jgi:hypothetical protein